MGANWTGLVGWIGDRTGRQDQKEKGVEEEQRVRECGEDMIGRKGTQ